LDGSKKQGKQNGQTWQKKTYFSKAFGAARDGTRFDLGVALLTICENFERVYNNCQTIFEPFSSWVHPDIVPLSWELSIEFVLSSTDSIPTIESDLIILEQLKVRTDLATFQDMQFFGDFLKGHQIWIPDARLKHVTADSLFYEIFKPSPEWNKPYAVRKVS